MEEEKDKYAFMSPLTAFEAYSLTPPSPKWKDGLVHRIFGFEFIDFQVVTRPSSATLTLSGVEDVVRKF